jgi:hypothetical protein
MLTPKERLVLQYLQADEGGETCAGISQALNTKGGKRWAAPALAALEKRGLAHRFGKAVSDNPPADIWHATDFDTECELEQALKESLARDPDFALHGGLV